MILIPSCIQYTLVGLNKCRHEPQQASAMCESTLTLDLISFIQLLHKNAYALSFSGDTVGRSQTSVTPARWAAASIPNSPITLPSDTCCHAEIPRLLAHSLPHRSAALFSLHVASFGFYASPLGRTAHPDKLHTHTETMTHTHIRTTHMDAEGMKRR